MTLAYDFSAFRRLDERPEATTLTVRNLLKRMKDGYIRLPDFQRPLRWRSSDVLQLLDSLWRGYPIGNFLLWKCPAEAGRVKVASVSLDVPARPDAWWVVDGQQRTTALSATLLEFSQRQDPRWILSFDPGEGSEAPAVGASTPATDSTVTDRTVTPFPFREGR